MDFARHGMNGQLAWAQGTGMPMGPAMSVTMTADVQATDAADAGLDVRLALPADVRPGQPTRLVATIVDAATGSPVEDLTHIHPQPTGQPGQLAVDITFPTPGRYIINTEFRRQGEMADVHARQLITIAGRAPVPITLTEGPRSVTVDGVRAGQRCRFNWIVWPHEAGLGSAAGRQLVGRAHGGPWVAMWSTSGSMSELDHG